MGRVPSMGGERSSKWDLTCIYLKLKKKKTRKFRTIILMGAIEFQPEPLIYQLWWGQKTDKNRKNGNSTKINQLSIIYNKVKDKN